MNGKHNDLFATLPGLQILQGGNDITEWLTGQKRRFDSAKLHLVPTN